MQFSIWLLPSDDGLLYLNEVVQTLAAKYSTPVFLPHLTVASPVQSELPAITSILEAYSQQYNSFSLDVVAIDTSPRRFESVVLLMKRTAILDSFRTNVWVGNSTNKDDLCVIPFRPHVSLVYGELSADIRKEIVESLEVKGPFCFSQLALMSPGPNGDWNDVLHWQVLAQFRLSRRLG